MNDFNPLVSIIVPVYNVGNYLRQCIESIRNQSVAEIEIICIDDGSTDDSSYILDEMTKIDSRIIVVHKRNSGVSEARNDGLRVAHGRYISFVDADDIVEKDFIKNLLDGLIKNNADIAVSDFYYFEDGKDKNSRTNYYINESCCIIDATKKIFTSSIVIWNKLYRASVIKNISFSNELRIGEDGLFLLSVLKNAHKVSFISNSDYRYRIRNGSASNRKFDETLFDGIKSAEMYCKLLRQMDIQLDTVGQYRVQRSAYLIYACANRRDLIKFKDEFLLVRKSLKENFRYRKKNPYINHKMHLALCCLCINEKVGMRVLEHLK